MLMRGNWRGKGTIPIQCPTWAILSLDHKGKEKRDPAVSVVLTPSD